MTEASGGIRVACTVKNTGSRAGAEVVQVYVAPRKLIRAPSATELKGFAKVTSERGRVPPG